MPAYGMMPPNGFPQGPYPGAFSHAGNGFGAMHPMNMKPWYEMEPGFADPSHGIYGDASGHPSGVYGDLANQNASTVHFGEERPHFEESTEVSGHTSMFGAAGNARGGATNLNAGATTLGKTP